MRLGFLLDEATTEQLQELCTYSGKEPYQMMIESVARMYAYYLEVQWSE